MSKLLRQVLVCATLVMMPWMASADDFQLTNSNFEDWSAAAFDGNPQPKGWNASHVEQVGMKFNFAHKETGHNGGYCLMVQDQDVGAMGITETSPGYFSIGKPWAYLPSIAEINKATAGTSGGQSWSHRPDTMSVWIKRTGSNTDKEDFYLLYYAWMKEAQGTSYKGKNTQCTSHSETNEESDIRIALNGNECKTTVAGEQVCEGMWRERATYSNWVNIRVPIYYFNDNVPKLMNVIFSASNYPNFRANDGLYTGNSLYVDDIELIYSSKIQFMRVGGKEWKGFEPNNFGVQTYAMPEGTTSIPDIEAYRGAGSITNAHGKTQEFPGRKLSGSEITITKGDLKSTPTTITVKSEDGKSTTTYKIQFVIAKSSNAKLANIYYNYTDKDGKAQRSAIPGFNPSTYNYKVELPYGAKGTPTLEADKQEDEQKIAITQPASLTGKGTIVVTAPNETTKATYNVTFEVGKLADNTLADIKVNDKSIPGFTPSQAVYKVSLPTTTTSMPKVEAISAYPAGEQTIVYKAPSVIDGGTYTISVSTPGNTVAKVYKLNFKLEASSYTYLKDLKVGDYITNFQPDKSTYYINLPLGTTSLPKISYEKGDEFQTVSVSELGAGVVDGTIRVTVTAGNGDQMVYKLVFSTEKSDNSSLKGIQLDGKPLPGFSPDIFSYTYELPVGTTELPEITVTPGDEYQAEPVITKGGVNGKTRITVTAGDGSTSIYQITFSVNAYTNNTLAALSVTGYSLCNQQGKAVEFDPEVNDYWINLPQGTTGEHPAVQYTLQDNKLQTVSIRDFSGLNGDYKITVRPQSGASRTYIIHFSVATSSNTKLAMIYLNGKPLECVNGEDTVRFDPEVTEYNYYLPEGVSATPNVTFKKGEDSQRVLNVLEGKNQIITVTAENGDKRVYTIHFIVRASANAYLSMIYLDSIPLAKFSEKVLEYNVTLTGERCPAITVSKGKNKEGQEVPQQVTITAPYGVGDATIKVLPEQGGTGNTYIIHFNAKTAESVQLANIAVNDVAIPGFKADSLHYTGTYSKALPKVTYTKNVAEQNVELRWKGDVAWLYVTDNLGNKNAYSVTFTRLYDDNTALKAILIDGQPLATFNPATKDYTINLQPGSKYPEVDYEVADEIQVVLFGQVEEGKYAISVTAENGDVVTYTVTFVIEPYHETTLADLQVEGYTINYNPQKNLYEGLNIEEGAALPQVNATMNAGQSVIILNVNDSVQKVMVMAEDSTENTYTIKYTRVRSNNTKLANLFIDGKALLGFDPDVRDYTINLTRGTQIVPNVTPVAQLDNQTVTTYFSRPNGVTKIEVMAQDGTKGYYTVSFPIEPSANTKLGKLLINSEEKDVNVTEYEFTVPFGTTEPYDISYAKAEDEQLIHFIDAPLSGVTKIIVTSQTGDKRTYSIRYKVAEPQGENRVTKVKYTYLDKEGALQEGELQPVVGNNIVNLPFGAKSFDVTEVTKQYTEQNIVFYNGGIRRGATIIVSANRANTEDVTYTITPKMPEFDTAGKLQSLKFRGEMVPNFRPDVYNYMINVVEQPTADSLVAIDYNGNNVAPSAFDKKTKQVTFTVEGGETYSVCWFYYRDETPFDFSGDWVPTTNNVPYYSQVLAGTPSKTNIGSTGYKPASYWHVPADYAGGFQWQLSNLLKIPMYFYTGKEVVATGINGVLLSTQRGSSLAASLPGMMTLGDMTISLGANASSSTSISEIKTNYYKFRNTPDSIGVNVKELSATKVSGWSLRFYTMDGTSNPTDATKSTISGTYALINKGWKYYSEPLKYSANPMKGIHATLNSANSESPLGDANNVYTSDLQLDNLHFVYNSDLTKATLDNTKTEDVVGRTFTFNVDDSYVGVPSLKFTKRIHDQMQTIEWLNNGEWIGGELKAKVTNYGENSIDNTVYTVVLHRDPITDLNYTIDTVGYPKTVKGDTVYLERPYGLNKTEDLTIQPNSIHQMFSIAKKGNAVSVIVTNEEGVADTTVYVFRETKNNNVALDGLSAVDAKGKPVTINTVDADQFIYSVEAEQMPTIEYTKARTGDDLTMGQTVDINYSNDSVIIIVTAGDGMTTRQYTINRLDPAIITSGQIKEFTRFGSPWAALAGDENIYETTDERPTDIIGFERKDYTDSVVYVQAPTKMEWQVYGSSNHTYVINYPTAKSANDTLATILLNGLPYSKYDEAEVEFDIISDSLLVVEPVKGEATQIITSTQQLVEGGIEYHADVTAEDGSVRQYIIRVRKPRSSNATLASILLDGKPLEDFDSTSFNYEVILPVPAVKREQPQLPSITYVLGQKGQSVEQTEATLNGNAAELVVTSENGANKNTYSVAIKAAKSTCVDLTGITVNSKPIDQFEPGRHYYSTSLKTDKINVDYTSDDRFQTVTILIDTVSEMDHQYRYTLEVKAENGDVANYEVMIYVENQSNDAQLANITLNGKDFEDFERALNTDLKFDGGNNSYEINLPAGTTVLPEVSAQLKMDKQSVEITQKVDSIILDVTAVDGKTHNQYVLHFLVPLSKNADLSMIFLNGDSINDYLKGETFEPTTYVYQIELPVGVHTMPEVAAQKKEAGQTLLPIAIDQNKLQATIRIQAEDKSYSNTYVVAFHFTQSEVDTLAMIYQDGQELPIFDPYEKYFQLSLPVGTTAFPELSWQEGDDWQTIKMDTVESNANTLIRQIEVISESKSSRTYTVSYYIEKSDVDSLQMIFIDQKQLPDFKPTTMEYYVTLSASYANELNGQTPLIEYITGDEYQTVMISQMPEDSLSTKSLGIKSIITVTAATGKTRIYTIHYPVELSTDATLNMINLAGKPLANFDSERFNYRVDIAKESSVPVVSVIKKEEVQVYEIRVIEDTVQIVVWAESVKDSATYTLIFERLKSALTDLRDIMLYDADSIAFPSSTFPYRPEVYSYVINLQYDNKKPLIEQIPLIEPVFYEEEQTADTTLHYLPNGDIQIDITVTAANGEDQAIYSLIFHFIKPADATLISLLLNKQELEGFRPTQTEYTYAHPYGTDSTDYFNIEAVSFILSDSLATDSIFMDENGIINVVITAQDGHTSNTYLITQITAEDGDNFLSWITINDDSLAGFDPEKTFYTYYLYQGDAEPTVDAGARSENAEVDKGRVVIGDTCVITCTAADGKDRFYRIHFAISAINPGEKATSGDVLLKRVPGSLQLMAATVRQGVTIGLYDQNGRQLFYEKVPVSNPNDADIILGADNTEYLNNVINTRSGLLIDVLPGQPYFYVFFADEKRKLGSGKVIVMP